MNYNEQVDSIKGNWNNKNIGRMLQVHGLARRGKDGKSGVREGAGVPSRHVCVFSNKARSASRQTR